MAARLEGIAEPGTVCVTQTVYEHVTGKVRFMFDDLGERNLKNIARPVRVYRARIGFEMAGTKAPGATSEKPSIAVLPFINMSGDPEQEFFVDGLTDEIITALSRISAFWVIARTSTFTYKGKPADVKQVAKELGVRYVMEGSARRSGDRVRVTAQLIDAETGHHVWADRYDRLMDDLFEIQDDITRSVASSTETHLYLAEGEAAKLKPTVDYRAWDLVAKAWARMWEEETPEGFAEASKLAEEAIRIEPLNPVAHRVRAIVFLSRLWWGEIQHNASNMGRALELAKTARRLAPRDEWAHMVMAWAHVYGENGKLEEAVAECERGLEINPNSSVLLGNLGDFLTFLGRTQEGIEACRLALRLDPRSPDARFWRMSIAIAHFLREDYEEALQQSLKVHRSRPILRTAIIWAASAAALGKSDEAQAAVEYCIAHQPDLRVGNLVPRFMVRFGRDADHQRLLVLLRKAGLPE
jgi:adenylate cyclase